MGMESVSGKCSSDEVKKVLLCEELWVGGFH
jgi:hypothetical protein